MKYTYENRWNEIDHGSAVVDLDSNRRSALASIDRARFSWFHVKVWLVAGAGFFTDAYDIFAIGIAAVMLGYVYGKDNELQPNVEFGLKVASPIGNLFGQVLFGWLADIIGRKRMYGVELIIIITSTFAQALAGSGPAVNAIGVITALRFFMGVGIGGDYPLSAVISSEFASTRTRGRLMTAVFASQGWGNLTAVLVAFIVISGYKDAILDDSPETLAHVDYCWRLLIGLGCVPGVMALYFRLTIPETPRFTMDVERNVHKACRNIQDVLSANGINPGVWYADEDAVAMQAEAPRASLYDFYAYFRKWRNLKVLVGTAYSWFVLDIAFYGLGLNTSKILTSKILQGIDIGTTVVPNTARGAFNNLHNITVYSLIVSAAGLIPGYWASFLVIDTWGRKPIQLMGFSVLSVLFLIMGFAYNPLTSSRSSMKGFVFLYCLSNFFQNFGPNVTTFVIPGEVFPTRYRSTGHGFSAACGKLGAIVAQVIFFKKGGDVKIILEILAFVMMTGILSTLLLPETKGRSLEELSNENQRGFIRGTNSFELRNGIVLRRLG
ncbi:MFS general substrate transporter [Auriscalpium vulgare]|uniref:MFS general substrate transporter n=1 Tax=Auriscalpium vulgare TaxID=40419 RepID=A0ACB8RRV1_9AGAM|nr:MFS general substrate transporter [Auriscalpium vulgare]